MLPVAVMTLLITALLGPPPPAVSGYRVGVSEQSAAMSDTVAWRLLELEHVRYLVPWDWRATGRRAEVDAFMRAARTHGQDVLVTFTARQGCFDGRRYSRARACRAPSARAYRRAVLAFDDRYPGVRAYSAWNEVNHISQPTFAPPRLAVRYYRVLRRERRRRDFRVLAADVLDTANMRRYPRAFLRLAPGRPRLWGLHNYQDVNARTSADTRWMFALADRYGTRRSGLRSRITRLYIYKWFGAAPGARFDAGLVAQDGAPRPAYFVVARRLARLARSGHF